MTRRRALLLGGLLAGFFGAVLVAVPSLQPSPSPAVSALLTLATVLLAVAVAVRRALVEDTDENDSIESFPRPERRPTYASPGEKFDRRIAAVSWSGRRAAERDDSELQAQFDDQSSDGTATGSSVSAPPRRRLAVDLHDMAVEVLVRAETITPETAADRLADGSWTDDAEAAALFTEGPVPTLSWHDRLPHVGSSDPPFTRRCRQAVAELARRLDETGTALAADTDDRQDRVGDERADSSDYWPEVSSLPVTRSTELTRGAAVGALIAAIAGVFFGDPTVMLVAAVAVALAVVAGTTRPPEASVRCTRSVDDTALRSGETTTVTVTVRNDGERTLPDVRIIDGVPPGLVVVDGTPRHATALRPGKTASFSYTVRAVAGHHDFRPTLLVAADLFGASETIRTVDIEGPMTIECPVDPGTAEPSIRRQVTTAPGHRTANERGNGVEFDSLRPYRPGDPIGRIDWNRLAAGGDLATVDHLEPRLPTVVAVVDTRREAYLVSPVDDSSSDPARADAIPAARRSTTAAKRYVDALLDSGIPVGLAAFSPGECWLPPAAGDDQRTRVDRLFADDPAFGWVPPTGSVDAVDAARGLHHRLAADVQAVLFSPLCDDGALSLARRLNALGHRVTVVSPDPTTTATPSDAYAHLRRRLAVSTLRRDGIPVVDIGADDTLGEVLARDYR